MKIETVKMYGPSISEPSRVVNRDVPKNDVDAYKAAGYRLGSIEEPPAPVVSVTEPEPVLEPVIEPPAKSRKGKGKK